MENTGVSTAIEVMTSLWNFIFGSSGIATQFVTWLIATPIALIPLALYVLVALFGLVKRVLPGV